MQGGLVDGGETGSEPLEEAHLDFGEKSGCKEKGQKGDSFSSRTPGPEAAARGNAWTQTTGPGGAPALPDRTTRRQEPGLPALRLPLGALPADEQGLNRRSKATPLKSQPPSTDALKEQKRTDLLLFPLLMLSRDEQSECARLVRIHRIQQNCVSLCSPQRSVDQLRYTIGRQSVPCNWCMRGPAGVAHLCPMHQRVKGINGEGRGLRGGTPNTGHRACTTERHP